MPDINMQVFEEVKRNQLVTEVDIQTQAALDDYQVQLSDIANPTQSQDNVVIDRFGEFLPHWNESLDFDTWVKMSMEVAGKRILMLRGNSSVSSASDGDNTFIQYHGAASANYIDSLVFSFGSMIYETRCRVTSDAHNINFGVSNQQLCTDDCIFVQSYNPSSQNLRYVQSHNEGTYTTKNEAPKLTTNVWYRGKVIYAAAGIKGYFDNNQIGTGDITTNIPNENVGLYMIEIAGSGEQEWSFIREYTATEPTWAADDEQNIAVTLKSLGRAG